MEPHDQAFPPVDPQPFDENAAPSQLRRGHPLIAWMMIAALVVLLVARPRPEEAIDDDAAPASLQIFELQAKYLVGSADLLGMDRRMLYQQSLALDVGSPTNRLAFAVLAGELVGPQQALERIDAVSKLLEKRGPDVTATQRKLIDALKAMYSDYAAERWDAPSLSDEQREILRKQLGWFGELALAPAEDPDTAARQALISDARRVALVLIAGIGGICTLGALGLLFLAVFAMLAVGGYLASRVVTPSGHGALYAETFAVWAVLFLVFSVAASLIPAEEYVLWLNGAAFLLSLTALVWLPLRRVAWSDAHKEIGWTGIRGTVIEIGCGLAAYVATLPALAVSLIVVFILISIRSLIGAGAGDELAPTNMPSHPILEWIAESGFWGKLATVFLACVAAPIVEETMFRGVLYRHLRDASSRWRLGLSVALSAAVTAFIFAVIHPQGLLGIPPLMTLAIAFALMREWRGSLIAPMTAHAANNGMMTMILLFIL